MKKMKKILIITNKYPNTIEPNVCVFVQQLVWSIADLGYDCSVVVPMPVNFNTEYKKFPEKSQEFTELGNKIDVYYPKYLSAGQSGRLLQKIRVKFTTDCFTEAVDSVIKKLTEKPDILYAHFICPAGVTASRLGKKYKIPAFMAHGEATYSGDAKYGNQKLKRELDGLYGLIAVSSQNKDYCIDAGIVQKSIVEVFPNGYRPQRFERKDKTEARKKFGFSQDTFIIGFCGSFDERKGVLRLQEAVEKLDNVEFACAGQGKLVPTSSKCVWSKPVNNEELAWFYSAIDAFVLPTRHEGCCNAIVEAIACGCPIISSDRAFNYDICDESNAILINPDDVNEIRDAIRLLRDDLIKRKNMINGSLEKAKQLTLENRAKKIMGFIERKVEKSDWKSNNCS